MARRPDIYPAFSARYGADLVRRAHRSARRLDLPTSGFGRQGGFLFAGQEKGHHKRGYNQEIPLNSLLGHLSATFK